MTESRSAVYMVKVAVSQQDHLNGIALLFQQLGDLFAVVTGVDDGGFLTLFVLKQITIGAHRAYNSGANQHKNASSKGISIKQQGHRPVIDGSDLHIGAKFAVFHMEAQRPTGVHELLVKGNGQIRLCRMGEARAAGF